ncbi:hypothetical protein Q8A73_023006 [Channa argus]|nr:hypothetical protein Q8A73_023006 [Channa argus]
MTAPLLLLIALANTIATRSLTGSIPRPDSRPVSFRLHGLGRCQGSPLVNFSSFPQISRSIDAARACLTCAPPPLHQDCSCISHAQVQPMDIEERYEDTSHQFLVSSQDAVSMETEPFVYITELQASPPPSSSYALSPFHPLVAICPLTHYFTIIICTFKMLSCCRTLQDIPGLLQGKAD